MSNLIKIYVVCFVSGASRVNMINVCTLCSCRRMTHITITMPILDSLAFTFAYIAYVSHFTLYCLYSQCHKEWKMKC